VLPKKKEKRKEGKKEIEREERRRDGLIPQHCCLCLISKERKIRFPGRCHQPKLSMNKPEFHNARSKQMGSPAGCAPQQLALLREWGKASCAL
jgi:hypothetical protein